MTVNDLITAHMPLAESIARGAAYGRFSYDEMKSAAYLGLVEAGAKFRREMNVPFPVYARPRISGAVFDYVREIYRYPKDTYVE